MTTAQISWPRRVWRGFTSHRGLKHFFDWSFEALAIMAVPLTIACTFIIAGRLSSPAFFASGIGLALSNFAENGLNAVIEGSILGCIAIEKKATRTEQVALQVKMSRLKWLFAALIITTVGFWVFKANQDASNVLLLVRCGAAVLYCIVVHSDNDAAEIAPVQPGQNHGQTEHIEELRRQIAELVGSVSQTNVSIAELAQRPQPVQISQPSVQPSVTTRTPVQGVQIAVQGHVHPVHTLHLLNITVDDEKEERRGEREEIAAIQETMQADTPITEIAEAADESTLGEDVALTYPMVPGVAEDVVKQIIDLHLDGVAWSAIASQTGKNYTRTVKPVKEAWTQANNDRDTEKLPVQIAPYR